jgi:hypothetical protein
MSTYTSTPDVRVLAVRPVAGDARRLLGQVMGYVAVTIGFTALGA